LSSSQNLPNDKNNHKKLKTHGKMTIKQQEREMKLNTEIEELQIELKIKTKQVEELIDENKELNQNKNTFTSQLCNLLEQKYKKLKTMDVQDAFETFFFKK
jgi:hypothetical protein